MTERRLRVLHLINTLEFGGAEKRIVDLVENLPPNEFEFIIICLCEGGAMEARARDSGAIVESLGYRRLRVNGRMAWKHLLEPYAAGRKFQQVLERHRPEVVQTWLPICNFIGGRSMCRWRFRHMPLIASRVFTSEYRQANPLIPIAEMMAARRADLVYCNSLAVRDDVMASEPSVDPSIIRVVRNGVDLRRFHPVEDKQAVREQLGLSPDAPIVLSVGALRPHKGHAVLLEAAGILLRGGCNAQFCFLGADQGEGVALRETAEREGILSNVHFIGAKNNVVGWLQAADVLALPSLEEGLPNVLLEAQASALPCVATSLPGCMEALDGGKCGLIVPPKDADALAGALGGLLNDEALRRRLGLAGREHVEAHWSRDGMFAQFGELYREAVRLRWPGNKKGAGF